MLDLTQISAISAISGTRNSALVRKHPVFASFIVGLAGLGLVKWTSLDRQGPNHAPTELATEGNEIIASRLEWIERIHAHPPGVNWRAIDAKTRNTLRKQANDKGFQGSQTEAVAPAGVWHERGANNWAGHVSDTDYDEATGTVLAFSNGGQIFRASRSGLSWQSINDSRGFLPYYMQEHLLRVAGSPDRLVVSDDTRGGFFYSDDKGATWSKSGGLDTTNWFETSHLVSRQSAGGQIYAMVWFNGDASRLLYSNDGGSTFSDLGLTDPSFTLSENQTALASLEAGSNLVYVLVGTTVQTINPDNSRTTVGAISAAPAQFSSVALTGGVDADIGQPFLFAFFESNGSTYVYRSLDGGQTWQTRGVVPSVSVWRMVVASSKRDPDIVAIGGVSLYRSIDGGMTFTSNNWGDYGLDISSNLHADIRSIKASLTSEGTDYFLIGTDGGIYESTDDLATVRNLNLTTMRQAQYYGSLTLSNPPYGVIFGAQDQGGQWNGAPQSGIGNYDQVLSGDYGEFTSSDGGRTVWMDYAPFGTQVCSIADISETGWFCPSWGWYVSGGFSFAYFFQAVMADPSDPKIAWLAGGSSTPGLNHIVRLTWDGTPGGNISSTEGTFDFGDAVTAIAHSPQVPGEFYATAYFAPNDGSRFFRTSTPLGSWTPVASDLPPNQLAYVQRIVPDPVRTNTIYTCGAGYSGPPVYVSTDDGDSFSPMSDGLPNTLVASLAISPDGGYLFAATEVGPFYFDRASETWVYIGAGAPDTLYRNVEYVPALRVARFSTFGRGIWDYDLGGGDLIFRAGYE